MIRLVGLLAALLAGGPAVAIERLDPPAAPGASTPRWLNEPAGPTLGWTEDGGARASTLTPQGWTPAAARAIPATIRTDVRRAEAGTRAIQARVSKGFLVVQMALGAAAGAPQILDRRAVRALGVAMKGDAGFVAWLTRDADEVAVRLARQGPEGPRGAPRHVASVPDVDAAAVLFGAESVLVAWSAPGKPLAVARVPLVEIGEARDGPPPSDLGAPLPALSAPDLDGNTRALAEWKGRPLLVNLWATWCLPCVRELPDLAALHATWAPRGLQMVGVALDDDVGEVEALVARAKLPWTVLHDASGDTLRQFAVAQVPATFLYDRAGTLVWFRGDVLRPDDPALVEALRAVTAAP
mgnify:CR=1 FL=1